MPQSKSYLTKVYEDVLERMEEMYQHALEAHPVPFGMEDVTPAEFRKRWQAGDDQYRLQVMDSLGVERVAALLQGGNHAASAH